MGPFLFFLQTCVQFLSLTLLLLVCLGPYINIYLTHEGKRYAKWKSSVHYDTTVEVFNEVFQFNISKMDVNLIMLCIHIKEYHRFGCTEGLILYCTVESLSLSLSNQDTVGPDQSVLNSEVSSFQRLLSTQMWHLRQKMCPDREVPLWVHVYIYTLMYCTCTVISGSFSANFSTCTKMIILRVSIHLAKLDSNSKQCRISDMILIRHSHTHTNTHTHTHTHRG